jgi:putative ABC transport system permease protein
VTASFFQNVPYAVRNLGREPLLAISATLTLAVCIGANTTVFSIANSVLVRPLPYPGSERIDWISERSGPNREDIGVLPDYYRLREGSRVFEDVAAFNPINVNWTGVERPEQLDAAQVSASFFRVMGMQPGMGRYLAAEEEGTKAPSVVVLSYDFWRSRLGSDLHVIGKTMALDRLPRTIVGVMPQGFDFPRGTQVWMPLPFDESALRAIDPTRPIFTVSLVARRKIGVSTKDLETELNRLAYLIRAEYRVFPTKFRWDLAIAASPLQQHLTGQLRPALLALSGAAGLVLLIACANLANLLLARAGSRKRELAIRLALGAGRGRIVRQMLTESFVLAAPGGIAGVAISWLAVHLLNSAKPSILARYPPISINLPVLAFTLGLTLAASMLFGMAPAASAAGIKIQEALKSAGMTYSGGLGAARLRKTLVVAELGVSLVLLIGADLLARTFLKLAHTNVGFRSDHLLTFRVSPIGPLGRDYSKFYSSVLDRLQHLPMAQSAALLLDIPLSDEDFYLSGRIRVVGRPVTPFIERPIINNTVVSPGFFRTLEIPLKSGRIFDLHESAQPAGTFITNYGMVSAAPVIVNEAFVRRMFPRENPLGQRIVFGPDRNSVTWTIVGVVGDIRGGALDADPPAMVYRCAGEGSSLFRAGFLVRTAGEPRTAIRAVEEQVRAVDRDQPIFDVKTMDERRSAALAPERFQLAVIGSFAAIAMLLAAAGVYGVMSYLVARRTREIGIRVAMGARPADVLRMVIGETMMLVLVAIGIGLGGAWALTRYVRSMLYGVTELDAATFGLAPVLLAAIVLIACFAPARYAARIDPTRALREE